MITSHVCSWCQHVGISLSCRACGHRADRSRLDCDCEQCLDRREVENAKADSDAKRLAEDRAADRLYLAAPGLLAACESAIRYLQADVEIEESEGRYGCACKLHDTLARAVAKTKEKS